MDLPWLMNQIETRPDELTERVVEAVRTSPGIAFLRELVYALILVKQLLWDYVQKKIVPESEGNLDGEELVNVMLGTFFDRALYHAVRGYEEAWATDASLRLLAGGAASSGSTTTGIARAVLGELDARRGVLDNDLRLRSMTCVVKLEPPPRYPPSRSSRKAAPGGGTADDTRAGVLLGIVDGM